MRLIFAGSGQFGVPALRALVESGHGLVQVVSQPDRPAGRGRGLTPTPVAQEALRAGAPLLRTDDINAIALPPADLMIVIAFGQKIAPAQVEHPRLGSINLHASRLPRYRGAAPINWAIIKGEKTTGNSVIRLAQRMDAGAIFAQSELIIGELETAGELHDRLSLDGVPLVLGVIEELSRGVARECPQDESQATTAPKLTRDSARLDFAHPAEELARRIRGLYPWPGCRVCVLDAAAHELGRLRLARARDLHDDEARWRPGEITSGGSIQTGQGTIQVLECQPEGGVVMSLAEYARGHRWQAGLRLESIA